MPRWWPAVIRLVVVLVLFSAVVDYCTFDVADPFASMSTAWGADSGNQTTSPGPARVLQNRTLHAGDLPDDCCLCCGTAIPHWQTVTVVKLLAATSYSEPPLVVLSPDLPLPKLPPRRRA